VKGRPPPHPLIVHIARADQLDDWAADVPEPARVLAERFWPGPLTLVLRRSPRIPDATTGGLETAAIRVPNHPVALALLSAFGGGVAAPSANRFGSVSPTTAAHVRAELGDAVDLVLDGGPCAVGVESTIVDVTGGEPTILRPGGVTRRTSRPRWIAPSRCPGRAASGCPDSTRRTTRRAHGSCSSRPTTSSSRPSARTTGASGWACCCRPPAPAPAPR